MHLTFELVWYSRKSVDVWSIVDRLARRSSLVQSPLKGAKMSVFKVHLSTQNDSTEKLGISFAFHITILVSLHRIVHASQVTGMYYGNVFFDHLSFHQRRD